MRSKAPSAETLETIASRYRIEAELGRGGMARVYRVVDERTGRRVALKKLFAGDRGAALRAMFEREYYTLVELAHPHIVRVFDYGLDGNTAYYTMELLEGVDSRETSRGGSLDAQKICLLLRDCASALALIHSRRMVHRDVSPRNLWCSAEGRAKLIDFGTLVPMGAQTRIAGTPPFVPPEAVYLQPLDGRSDLYSLGALAYYLLTDRNAYPARELGELVELWQRRPKRPDAIRPEIPTALADLVMSLLNLDPRGRPSSAAEVFERLTVIGALPSEDERHLAQAFLTSPKLVGRAEASASLRKQLRRALGGRGNTISIVSKAGLGRSRMLTSLILEAKLTGATTLAVEATAVGSGPLALATAIAERLFEAQPMAAALPSDVASVLGNLSPAVFGALGEPKLTELALFTRTRKLSAALFTLFEAASQNHRLVIAVDDVHRADNASLALLGKLSLAARDRRLLLVTTCDADTLERPPPALVQLVANRQRVELSALAPEHTRELLESLFGAVPGLEEAASWLHELSQGSPQTCMQYAQYLVDEGVARYEGGHWKLPLQLREQGLPATLGAMFDGRIATLSANARAVALGLVLSRDETRSSWQPELHLHIEDLPKLLDSGEAAQSFAALDELVRAGVAQQRDGYYVLAQRTMVDALLRATDDETRKRVHVRLAEIFAQGNYSAHMLPVVQLQHAGEHARARQLLVTSSVSTADMDWSTMRLSVSAACALTAIEHWREDQDSPRDGIVLRRQLLLLCSVYDWSLARFGDAQLARLSDDCGISRWNETDASLAPLQRVFECLKLAQQAYEQTPEALRGYAPIDAIREIAACAMPLSGGLANSHDVARISRLPALLQPLRLLSPLIDLLAGFCDIGVERLAGKELRERLLVGVERLQAASELPMVLRDGGAAVYLHMQSVEDARRGRKRGIQLIEKLVPHTGEDMFMVAHARWLNHAFLGHAEEAERFRKQVEMITEDDVWRRNAFLIVEVELCALTGDLLTLKRVTEAVAVLAERFEGFVPWLNFARATTRRLHGDTAGAMNELTSALELARPGEHRAWLFLAPALAELHLKLGQTDVAEQQIARIAEAVEAHSLDRTLAITAARIAALCHSAKQQHPEAQANLAQAFAVATEVELGGLPLARLFEAQAKISLEAGDAAACVCALREMWTLIEHADAAALIGAYEALREASRQLTDLELPAAIAATRSMVTDASAMLTEVHTRLTGYERSQERATEALELLLQDSGALAGQLFLFDASGLFRAASVNQNVSDDETLSAARQYVEARLAEVNTVTVTATELSLPVLTVGDNHLSPVLLANRTNDGPVLVGLALLSTPPAARRTPRSELVRVISGCLLAAGDSVAVAMAE